MGVCARALKKRFKRTDAGVLQRGWLQWRSFDQERAGRGRQRGAFGSCHHARSGPGGGNGGLARWRADRV